MGTASDSEGEKEAQHYYCTEEPKVVKRVLIDYPYPVLRTVDTDYYRILGDMEIREMGFIKTKLIRNQLELYGPAAPKTDKAITAEGSPDPQLPVAAPEKNSNAKRPSEPVVPKPENERKQSGLNFMSPTPTELGALPGAKPTASVYALKRQLFKERRLNPRNWSQAPSKSKN